uniref:Uncharacterized protein n=1 Tax=Arundo donax TaxID=35708 RepID=A0A0A9BMG0_ARUDO
MLHSSVVPGRGRQPSSWTRRDGCVGDEGATLPR